MVNRVVAGGHYVVRDWIIQHITALVMLIYTLALAGVFLVQPHMGFADWQALFANQAFKLLTFLVLVAVILHAWVGMRDIWKDYVKPVSLRLSLEVLTISVLIAYTGWTINILWGLGK